MRGLSLSWTLILLMAAAGHAAEPELTEAERARLRAETQRLNEEGAQLIQGGKFEEAIKLLEKALAIADRLYPATAFPDGHEDIVPPLNNLGYALRTVGALDEALPLLERGAAMYRRLLPPTRYPEGTKQLATALNNLAAVYALRGDTERGLAAGEEALAIRRRLYPPDRYPDGHVELAYTLTILGSIRQTMGSLDQALAHSHEALAINRKLYPREKYPAGHSGLAGAINNVAVALRLLGAYDKAAPYYQESLAINQALYPPEKYPEGHAALARSLGNMAVFQGSRGRYDEAIQSAEQALIMVRKLYPRSKHPAGHGDEARTLMVLGWLRAASESFERGLADYRAAHAVYRELYPETSFPGGHPFLQTALHNLGTTYRRLGRNQEAADHLTQALAMNARMFRQNLLRGAEAEALRFAESSSQSRAAYLSTDGTSPEAAYRIVWDTKSAVTRVSELRHAAARAAGTASADHLSRLQATRRRLERILQETRTEPAERQRQIETLSKELDRLERELAQSLPLFELWRERDQRTPDDLARALPAGAAFIDTLAYWRLKQGVGSGELNYVAFIISGQQPIRRVELGPAASIDRCIVEWRREIETGAAERSAVAVRTHVWDQIARHLPPDTRRLFIAADGDLTRLPWAALPIENGVLLERFTVATVPHAAFLLDQFRETSTAPADGSLLCIGDVSYGMTAWPALPGTRAEIASLSALAPGKPVVLTGSKATAAEIAGALQKASYAHLATHGSFRVDLLRAEREQAKAIAQDWKEGPGGRQIAARNTLAYVGLVLADGEAMTGLSIVDMALPKLRLVTLSACETGLGDITDGEGVFGLTRAFHLAGCPNVVASLWKVNDAATAALMAKFYHEMWVNKRPPIEALREAQLTIYRRTDLIPALATVRGLKLEEALNAKSTPPAEAKGTTPTKLWAAFVLSGVGR